jgi:hypothetical protein
MVTWQHPWHFWEVAAMAAFATGCWSPISENDSATSQVIHFRVTDETNQEVLTEGCALSNGHAKKIVFQAGPGQHVAERLFAEDVDKSQPDPIPGDDDAFWCSTRADASRKVIRGSAREACASTDPTAPATLDSVELIDPQPSGLNTTSSGYILHLTVTGSGELRLVFKAPPCAAPGSRAELTILPP